MHIARLRADGTLGAAGYLAVRKGYVGNRPRTWLTATDAGAAAGASTSPPCRPSPPGCHRLPEVCSRHLLPRRTSAPGARDAEVRTGNSYGSVGEAADQTRARRLSFVAA
jgi:hypothetical protein